MPVNHAHVAAHFYLPPDKRSIPATAARVYNQNGLLLVRCLACSRLFYQPVRLAASTKRVTRQEGSACWQQKRQQMQENC
jgi:hypothetical protein